MNQDKVTLAFSIINNEIRAIVGELNAEGAEAFRHSRYDEVDSLRALAQELAMFLGDVEHLQTLWHTKFNPGSGEAAQPLPSQDFVPPNSLDEKPMPEEVPVNGKGSLLGRLDQF